MQTMIVRIIFSALLLSGSILLFIAYGISSAHALGASIEVPLMNVETGQCNMDDIYTITIHGGAVTSRGNHAAKITYMNPLLTELRSLLDSGARAIDVVEAAISNMEGSGLFNAGRGAIANKVGVIELDASIMDGRKLRAGSVAAVTTVRNPISAARMVMDKSEHVMLVGPNADEFTMENGGVVVDPAYFLHGGQNFSDVPLPADLSVAVQDNVINADKQGLLGVWGGVSSKGDLNHILVVEKVQTESANVIYALGRHPLWGKGRYRRLTGLFVEEGLRVIEPTDLGGYTLVYRLNSNDTLSLTATHPNLPDDEILMTRQQLEQGDDRKGGTVGAAVRDRCGDLAAGTSTGGYRSKTPGRVGDSPIIGAGTYADNETAAISATGHGEYFMRHVVAYDITALMKYKGLSIEDAATNLIKQDLHIKGLSGGVIAVDRDGEFVMTFNTEGMVRGVTTNNLEPLVTVY